MFEQSLVKVLRYNELPELRSQTADSKSKITLASARYKARNLLFT